MPTKCEACPLRKKSLFVEMTKDEVEYMQRFKVGEMTVDAGTPLLSEGSNTPQVFTALKGMGLRYKTTESGRRQVINLIFPGDFIGLQASVMGGGYIAGRMRRRVDAATADEVAVRDGIHGLTVWAVAILIGTLALGATANSVLQAGQIQLQPWLR